MTNLRRLPTSIARLPSIQEIDAELARRAHAREREECRTLVGFCRHAWRVLEPMQPYIHGPHIEAICQHLEAITWGTLLELGLPNRLLENVPPGSMKSLLNSVFWPAWEWGPCGMPAMRYVTASHSEKFAKRDARKMRDLVESKWYQSHWGDTVQLVRAGETSFANTATGFREAMPFRSLTGARGDRVIIDDPHSTESAESEAERETTTRIFKESVPTRVNDPVKSAIVVVMQRLHEADVSGVILEDDMPYVHLMLPMEYEPERRCTTPLGFTDWRTEPGELLCPERFPREVVERDKRSLGAYGAAGQFQQAPVPRGGGIFKREWFRVWEEQTYPPFEFVLASADTAYTEKEENDPTALTIWGYWRDQGRPRVMLMWAWRKWLPFSGPDMPKLPGESTAAWERRTQDKWGLVDWLIWSAKRFKADLLIIEGKASGISAMQEAQRRIARTESFGVKLVSPGSQDKVARCYAVQGIFSNGIVSAPAKDWADLVIDEMTVAPKGRYMDLTDSATQAMKEFRAMNLITFADEDLAGLDEQMQYRRPDAPLYPGC